ncbi:hypothetical protein JOC37_000659 [Desulfohalotomaculum tongense]|nr:hypothetical protein [Desulforadius tongensis]
MPNNAVFNFDPDSLRAKVFGSEKRLLLQTPMADWKFAAFQIL